MGTAYPGIYWRIWSRSTPEVKLLPHHGYYWFSDLVDQPSLINLNRLQLSIISPNFWISGWWVVHVECKKQELTQARQY